MAQNTIKENPNIYIFLAMVFIIVSIILIAIELQEYYKFFSNDDTIAPTTITIVPTTTTSK